MATESDPTSGPAEGVAPVSDAKAKAAARQAKLLAKSQERLAKITAKGDGRVISDAAVGIPSRPAPSSSPSSGPPPPSSLAAALAGDDDPAEVDLAVSSSSQGADAFNPFAAFGLPGGPGAPGGAGGGDPFAALLQQLGGPGGPGGDGASGFNGLGQGGMMPPGMVPIPPVRRTRLDRLFPIVHVLAMAALAIYVIGWIEPARRTGAAAWGLGGWDKVNWKAWSALKYRPVADSWRLVAANGLAEVPLLWMFITVELVLQTTRLMLVRNQAPSGGLLNTVLPMLQTFSPQLATILQTGMWYIQLLGILLNDFAVLVSCLGVAVIYAQWREGDVGHGLAGVVDGVKDGYRTGGLGWNAARGEL